MVIMAISADHVGRSNYALERTFALSLTDGGIPEVAGVRTKRQLHWLVDPGGSKLSVFAFLHVTHGAPFLRRTALFLRRIAPFLRRTVSSGRTGHVCAARRRALTPREKRTRKRSVTRHMSRHLRDTKTNSTDGS